MKITKQKDHYLLSNDKGEYHISIEEYTKLGKEKSIILATRDIDKKSNAEYLEKTIDLKKARSLGFCEYGIKDFCKKLNLDINKTYTLELLKQCLSEEVFLIYPDECIKLFGNKVFLQFGGIKSFLSRNKTSSIRQVVLCSGILDDKTLHKLSCEFALHTLHIFENEYPDDKRPRQAIEAKLDWIDNKITDQELEAHAAYTAYTAANAAANAAYTAADAAATAADAAATAATAARAAHVAVSTSTSASAYAASAEVNWQIDRIILAIMPEQV